MSDGTTHDNDDSRIPVPRPVDLTSLDPTRDGGPRFDAIVRSIAVEAMAARVRRRRRPRSVLTPVVAWGRLTLAAAAVVMIVAGSALVVIPAPAAAAPASLAESAGIPAPLADLATSNRALSFTELVDALDTMAVATHGH